MKTEKQVERMLADIDEEIVKRFRRKVEEYTKAYNKATYEEDKYCYAQRLLALMDFADALGYDWKNDIEADVRHYLHPLVWYYAIRRELTEGL